MHATKIVEHEVEQSSCGAVVRPRLGRTIYEVNTPAARLATFDSVKTMSESVTMRCSFCQKAKPEVRKLIAGPNVFICDECVEICVVIIANDAEAQNRPVGRTLEVTLRAFPSQTDVCVLCGKRTPLAELLPVENRGSLCGDCADAVEDALTQGRPSSSDLSS
jgi:hypothetical protein